MILSLVLALTAGPMAVQDRSDAYFSCQSQSKGADLQACLDNALANEDRFLNAAYRAARQGLDRAEVLQLRDRQRAWIRARDAAGDSRAADQSDPALARAARTDCLLTWTAERNLWLENTYLTGSRK
ncbi:lysozyme inhibitor LprI family protein [Brevundimonas sp. TWP1-2-1b1]|uniref:lysozyme inhibitor LprI family protein n=1 Tax=unclassified Brevundimonas TaxID=2622653 RepID=UPI003CF394B4